MGDWEKLWAEVDDDYLVGIANRGIVKRAYKDKADGDYKVISFGEESEVSVADETVRIKFPLGDSSCSCPSRSVCRHIVLGILALRDLADGEAGNGSGKEEDLQRKLMEEIKAYPMAAIRRILSSRQIQEIASQAKAGQWPGIDYSSIIMAELTGMGHKVKLLSPLEYSSCTCHKKEFCAHKAAAVLWCKLEAKELTAEELEEETVKQQEYDMGQIKEAAGQMKVFLEELLGTGLARVAPDITDYLERLAVISHNASLARFEGYWRALYDSYGDYLKRKASFRTRDLMEQLTRLYRRTELLLLAENSAEAGKLAGEFKGEYRIAGNLDLTGIAIEHFESKTGYEGETIYFLEERTKEWYTYTSARPVYYEKTGKQRGKGMQQAPWGLPLSLEALAESRICLTGAKCDGFKRLSSSQDTKGELAGNRGKEKCLCTEDLGGWYYRNFGRLYMEQIGKRNGFWLRERENAAELVFLRPHSCKKAFFSETEQKLFMSLYDEKKREVVIEVAYSSKEAWGIRYLERLTEEKLPCFLGKVYLRDGKIRMYPVAVFEEGELKEKDAKPEEISCGEIADMQEMENGDGAKDSGSKERRDKEEALGILLEDIGSLLEELLQSGFDAVHDSTLESLGDMTKLAVQYGMPYLAGMLEELVKKLFMRRHQLEQKEDGLEKNYTDLNEYLYLCREKTAYDKGRNIYCCGLDSEKGR